MSLSNGEKSNTNAKEIKAFKFPAAAICTVKSHRQDEYANSWDNSFLMHYCVFYSCVLMACDIQQAFRARIRLFRFALGCAWALGTQAMPVKCWDPR